MTVFRDGKKREIPCATDLVIGRPYWGAGHKACIADFYRSIENGTPYPNTPASCDETMRVLLKLYQEAAR
ncbi:MAG: hypothetical protein IJI21_02820 [Clostridia bacterium]|nr:hypothetical protein [Clostridia bacterium]